MIFNVDLLYPIGAIYRLEDNAIDPSLLFGGQWELKNKLITTDWLPFSWANDLYIGTTQSSYNRNKWRVINNILYITVGAGATATINTGDELEICRIPIQSGINTGSDSINQVWIGAVGMAGAQAGFALKQLENYMQIRLKPHTSANDFTGAWYSTHFSIPLDEDFKLSSDNLPRKTIYEWKRVA